MEKTEAVNKLRKAGYQVQFDSSVVTVLLEKKANVTQEIKKLKFYLQEIGYDASFGIKQIRSDVLNGEKSSLSLETEEMISESEEIMTEMETLTMEKSIEKEETLEIGEQFSLEDFGIS